MSLDSEVDGLEECMDFLIRDIRKYAGKENLSPLQRKGLKHMQRRYCRYQVLHKRATGSYYLLNR